MNKKMYLPKIYQPDNRIKLIKNIFVVILFMLFKAGTTYASTYADTYGFSTTGVSLGNAMVAHVDDWSSLYYNISGLGRTYDPFKRGEHKSTKLSHIALNYLYASPSFNIDINRQNESGSLETEGDKDLDSSLLIVGLVVDIDGSIYKMPEFISSARFGAAVGIDEELYGFKINDEDPRTHTFLRYGSEINRVVMYTGFGFGFLEDLFGIGYGLYISAFAEGSAVAEEVPIVLSDDLVLKSQVQLDAKLTFSNLFGLYFQPGKKWKKLERLNLGLSYRSESEMEVDPLLVNITSDLGNVDVKALLTVIDFYQPNTITAGISYLFGDKTLVSVDYETQQWSQYEFTSEKEFNYGDMLPEFEDISIAKIGVQYKMSDKFTVLGGYYFQPSFISDRASSGLANFLDNDKHVFSIGLKYLTPRLFNLYRPLEITVGYQMQQLEERKVYKTDPTGPNPNYSYGGESHAFMIGVTY
jgi:hypothetical protein